ncbi:MAG: hypothetical protein EOM37_13115 [Proteobacteria bacterium]|nr:hypothetical protein [Pseudomonadota bacterium]
MRQCPERHVLGLSGGRDSAALAVFMRQHHPELDIDYFFTDTGKELDEVYTFLHRLEGFLGKRIVRLNPDRDFDFWLKEYNHFLPSPRSRWCTRQLKLEPFKSWVRPLLKAGTKITSYVAIRSDEDQREGMVTHHSNLKIEMPFCKHGVDKQDVIELLEGAGIGMPDYYKWRSRSGCTFCFFQQKIEWVRLKRWHPNAFEEAKGYEKTALSHGSPFTWSQGESLEDLERPERMAEIEKDFEMRRRREFARRVPNPLRPDTVANKDIDALYGDEEGNCACLVCHK